MAEEIQTLNVRLPQEIIKWIDILVKNQIYSNRSEAVRDFIRKYVRTTRSSK
jgi:Arc/MetJ-type ribon-helix-helix transcriptional regulator